MNPNANAWFPPFGAPAQEALQIPGLNAPLFPGLGAPSSHLLPSSPQRSLRYANSVSYSSEPRRTILVPEAPYRAYTSESVRLGDIYANRPTPRCMWDAVPTTEPEQAGPSRYHLPTGLLDGAYYDVAGAPPPLPPQPQPTPAATTPTVTYRRHSPPRDPNFCAPATSVAQAHASTGTPGYVSRLRGAAPIYRAFDSGASLALPRPPQRPPASAAAAGPSTAPARDDTTVGEDNSVALSLFCGGVAD